MVWSILEECFFVGLLLPRLQRSELFSFRIFPPFYHQMLIINTYRSQIQCLASSCAKRLLPIYSISQTSQHVPGRVPKMSRQLAWLSFDLLSPFRLVACENTWVHRICLRPSGSEGFSESLRQRLLAVLRTNRNIVRVQVISAFNPTSKDRRVVQPICETGAFMKGSASDSLQALPIKNNLRNIKLAVPLVFSLRIAG